MSEKPDSWAAGAAYEAYMGRWSRALARELVGWVNCPAALDWLDIGCGTGALAHAICELASPRSVLACDPAPPFIAYARSHHPDSRVTYVLAGAEDFPIGSSRYGSISSLLALNFFPDPARALRRMADAAAPGSVISACVWDYAGGMQFLRYFWDVAVAADERARTADEGTRFPLCRPDQLQQLFADAGLNEVSVAALQVPTRFASFEDYWRPFLGGTGPAPAFLASLDAERHTRLRDRLQQTLPVRADGSIALAARAWAVRGLAGE